MAIVVVVLTGIALALAGWVALGQVGQASQGARVPTAMSRSGTLPAEIDESSGAAASRRQPGVIWTHNDSGNEPLLFAIDTTGTRLAVFRVTGARNVDWEDLALAPCPGDASEDCLYIADTGNNLHRPRATAIYIVPEPRADRRRGQVTPRQRVTVSYPDGAQDVEALAVAPDGHMYLVTKGFLTPPSLYVIPPIAVRTDSVMAHGPTPISAAPGSSPLRAVTGAAFSPSGDLLVVRTYFALHFFSPDSAGALVNRGAACVIGRVEPQGEAVDFLTEQTLILTSEATAIREGTVHVVTC